MKNVDKKIEIKIIRKQYFNYSIQGLTLIDVDGNEKTFNSLAKMAEHLNISRQGLYEKIDKAQLLMELEELRKLKRT